MAYTKEIATITKIITENPAQFRYPTRSLNVAVNPVMELNEIQLILNDSSERLAILRGYL